MEKTGERPSRDIREGRVSASFLKKLYPEPTRVYEEEYIPRRRDDFDPTIAYLPDSW